MGRFSRVSASVTGLGAFSKGMFRGSLGLFAPVRTMKHTLRNVGKMGADAIRNPKMAAIASMELLGTAAGVTYVTRMVAGRGLLRDRKGRKDILPWIPYI